MIPRIAYTPGEPAGIGLDLCVLAARKCFSCEIIVFGDYDLLVDRAKQLGIPLTISTVDFSVPPKSNLANELKIVPIPCQSNTVLGKPNAESVPYILKTIDQAVRSCMTGCVDALVTGPIHKGIINSAGISFSGHTEYIAGITGGIPVMMLVAPALRVALVTTHLPLSSVSAAITSKRIKTILRILNGDLIHRFGIANPRILVCGLNPHAGEGGYIGREDIDVIEPALTSLSKEGLCLEGPLPADTLFTPKYLEQADVIVAMYHDQGLPVLKHIGFGQAVNITLGLPIIRTSVDHGTALDLAGSGRVDTGSLIAAIHAAIDMVENHAVFGRQEMLSP